MLRSIVGKCVVALCLMCVRLNATEYQPWLGNFYEFELRSTIDYEGYAWLASGAHHKKLTSNNVFLNLSLCNAIPDPAIGVEFEVTEASTRKQHGEIDQLKLTGRYLWQDDIAGDPCSVILGVSYTQAFEDSLRDIGSFHHGLYNTECFVSIGKEWPDESLWGSRWWSVFAIGLAEQGSPWLRFRLDYDNRFAEKHAMGVFLHSLWGLGDQKLRIDHFRGYGPVRHQSIDVGLRYTYAIEYYGHASLEYSYRLYSSNFPAYAHCVLAQVLYTFGL